MAAEAGHRQPPPFRSPEQVRLVTVMHPVKDIKLGTLKSIEKQSGVTLRK